MGCRRLRCSVTAEAGRSLRCSLALLPSTYSVTALEVHAAAAAAAVSAAHRLGVFLRDLGDERFGGQE